MTRRHRQSWLHATIRLTAVAALTLLALAGRPAVAWQLGGDEESHVRLNLHWERDGARPGSWLGLAVVLKMDEGWHIWPGIGTPDENPDYIATSLGINKPDNGWIIGPIQWPATHPFVFFGDQLKVYENGSTAYVPVFVPDGTAPGAYEVSVNLYFQTCNAQTCLMPTTISETIAVKVVDVSASEPQAVSGELFSNYTPPTSTPVAAKPVIPPAVGAEGHRVTLSLRWQRPNLVPGDQIGLAVIMEIEPNWHIWPFAGSGFTDQYPSTLTLRLSDGWAVAGYQWPQTHTIRFGEAQFADEYDVYENRAIAFTSVSVPRTATPGSYDVSAIIEYQACDDKVCETPVTVQVTQAATVASTVDAGNMKPDDETSRIFLAFKPSFAVDAAEAEMKDGASGLREFFESHFRASELHWWFVFICGFIAMAWMTTRTMIIGARTHTKVIVTCAAVLIVLVWGNVTVGLTGKSKINWVPFTPETLQSALDTPDQLVVMEFTADWCLICKTLDQTVYSQDEVITALNQPNVTSIRVDLSHESPEEGEQLSKFGGGGIPLTVVYQPDEDMPSTLFRGPFTAAGLLDALKGHVRTTQAGTINFNFLSWQFSIGAGSWLLILILAVIAGFFMNFTPCVLPVIPLKILSLQAHAKNPARCFGLGVIFGLGIVAAYTVLGVFIAGLAGATRQIGWGEIFTYWFVSLPLGLIIAAMGLGMLGLFTVRLPNFVYMFNPQSDSAKGSFFFGIFTAILSTPCTGPLLGAAVTWATTQPPILALGTFTMMGVGMAFPYVLLTANPKWIDRLPHAGPGSELIKQVMGLLLFAVAVWFIGIGIKSLSTRLQPDKPEPTAAMTTTLDGDLDALAMPWCVIDHPDRDASSAIRSLTCCHCCPVSCFMGSSRT